MERDFKGVWIPREIWECKDLNEFDIMLLSEIHNLSKLEKGCIAGDEYFINFMSRDKETSSSAMRLKIQRSLKRMKDLGFVKVVSTANRLRELRTCLDITYIKFDTPAVSKMIHQLYQNPTVGDIKNDTDNNINKKTNKNLFNANLQIPFDWPINDFLKLWDGFAAVRKRKNKPLVNDAVKLLIDDLIKHSGGKWDAAESIIKRSIKRAYTEFYPLTEIDNKKSDDADKYSPDRY